MHERVVVDVLMVKHLLNYDVDEFRVKLPRPIKDYKKEELRDVGIRTAIPTDPEQKHFVVRTCCDKCYRVEHEGLGPHLYSIHSFKNASGDSHARYLLEKSEALERVKQNERIILV